MRVVGPVHHGSDRDAPIDFSPGKSYQADEHELFYLTVGKGYGSGGPVPPVFMCLQAAPEVFGMDTLWSYEVGAKSALLDGRMRLDTGLFHIV